MNIKDQEIIQQLRLTDINTPLHTLYRTYFGEVTKLITYNGGDEDDAADIFQETILVFVEMVKTNRYRGESTIKTFLYAVAKNLWNKELRTRSRRFNREVKYSSGEEQISTGADNSILNKDMQCTLDNIYKQIGETCREILKGFYYEELSMKELLNRFKYENEQVLRNKKSICMKKIKAVLQENKHLTDTFKNLLFYGR